MTDLPPPPSPDPTPPTRNRALVLAGVGFVVVAVLFAGALVLRKRQQDHYCEVYDRTHAALVKATRDASRALTGVSASDLRGMQQALEASRTSVARVNGLLAERRDAAPGSLRGSYDDLIADAESSDGTLSQRKAREEAVAAVNDYARDVCGLAGDM